MADACQCTGDQHRRQRGREDEARRIAADAVDDGAVGRDIATHDAERLAERALDNRQPVCDVVAFRNSAAMLPVHPDSMDFVEIGEGVILVGKVADRADRRDVGVHRIDAFKRDQLGGVRVLGREQFLEMFEVVMAEDAFLAAAALDAGDHRGVVELVREDDAAGEQAADCRQCRFI